ncbi:MAG TPA: hypothetical protein VFI31_19960 [Pirellulales bacterium]|nr:hypothetical protein [Pirellulales bacterium]
MDQVKVYAGVAKKHHFWILFAIVVIVAIVVWSKASSSLATKYESEKRTITGAQDSVSKLGSSEQVNPKFTTKVESLHEGLKNQVFEAWQKLYERQDAMFAWPDLSEFDVNVDLKKLGAEEEIPNYIRVVYNENVSRQQWRELLEAVKLRRPKEKQERSEDSDEDEGPRAVEYEGLVVWREALRDAIISRYYTLNATPSTTRIRLAQEDYWLFQALIEVVNTVNAGAEDSLKAPIKEIQTLDVAQWAIAASLESGAPIWTKDSKSSGNSSSGMTGPPGGLAPAAQTMSSSGAAGANGANAASGSGGAAASGGPATPSENDNEWLADRYLDDKGQPLPAGATQPFAEFKQVFVYMRFIMDQRRIPNLVAACANARLPIETRQLRVRIIKTDDGDSLFSGGSGGSSMNMGGMAGGAMGGGMMSGGAMNGGMMPGGAMNGGMTSGGAMNGGMTSGGPMNGGMTPGGDQSGGAFGGAAGFGGLTAGLQEGGVETTTFDALVELSGVIYLYTPPDLAKLGSGAAGSPEKRSFGVPTKPVHPPGSSSSGGGMTSMGMSSGGPGR